MKLTHYISFLDRHQSTNDIWYRYKSFQNCICSVELLLIRQKGFTSIRCLYFIGIKIKGRGWCIDFTSSDENAYCKQEKLAIKVQTCQDWGLVKQQSRRENCQDCCRSHMLVILEMHKGTIDLLFHLWDLLKLWGLEILKIWGAGTDSGRGQQLKYEWFTWLGTSNMWSGRAAKLLWPVMSPDQVCSCTPSSMFDPCSPLRTCYM